MRLLPLQILPVTTEAEALADGYLAAGIWTPRSKDDAVHIEGGEESARVAAQSAAAH
jgi:hypothetical protein